MIASRTAVWCIGSRTVVSSVWIMYMYMYTCTLYVHCMYIVCVTVCVSVYVCVCVTVCVCFSPTDRPLVSLTLRAHCPLSPWTVGLRPISCVALPTVGPG